MASNASARADFAASTGVGWRWFGLLALLCAFMAAPARAEPDEGQGDDPVRVAQATEEEAPRTTAERRRRQQIEEVTVTARKREETLLTVPASVTAFDVDMIREVGISDPTDLTIFTPNLTILQNMQTTAGTTVFMRGFGRTDFILTEDPFAGLYVDGVYLGKSVGSLLDFLELERVEVLRGPHGNLYGKNAVGGAVNFITRKPSGEYGGTLGAEYGNYDHRRFKGTIDIPIIAERLAATISFLSFDRDGFTRNRIGGEDIGADDTQAARVAVRWTPTDSLSVDYAYDWTKRRGGAMNVMLTKVDTSSLLITNAILFGLDPRPFINHDLDSTPIDRFPGREYLDVEGNALTLTWGMGDVGAFKDLEIVSVSGYRRANNRADNELDGTPYDLTWAIHNTKLQQLSSELRAHFTMADGRVDGILGAYYFEEEGRLYEEIGIFPVFGFQSQVNVPEIENDTLSFFADFTGYITDKLSLGGGIRYDLEHKEMFRNQTTDPLFGFPDIVNFKGDRTFVNWSPRATLSYEWSDDVSTYMGLSRAFRSGGWDGRASEPKSYNDANVTSFEVGVKSRLWDDRLVLNASYFYQVARDLQFQIWSPVAAAGGAIIEQRIDNVGKANYRGAEIELQARPVAGLELLAGIGYISPEFEEFKDPVFGDVKNRAKFQVTPKYTFNGSVRYTFPETSIGTVTARVDYYASSSFDMLTIASDDMDQGKYALLNARLELADIPIGSQGLTLYLWGQNLANRDYRVGGTDWGALGVVTNSYANPRTYGVGLTYEWGAARSY
jgi:iron complex outermembrane receptor protein